MDLTAALESLGKGLIRKPLADGVVAFAERRAMHRVRSYTSAGLGPLSDRNVQEAVLLGHVHVVDGKAVRVEGFNGAEGARWAEKAADVLHRNGLLGEAAVVRPETPLKACPQALPH